MKLMELHTICICHPLNVSIVHHTVVFPLTLPKNNFLIVCVLINKVVWPTKRGIWIFIDKNIYVSAKDTRRGREAQEAQRKPEGVVFIAPKNHTIVDLSSDTVFFVMPVDTTEDYYVFAIATFHNYKPLFQPVTATSSSSISSPRTSTAPVVSSSSVLDTSFTSSFKNPRLQNPCRKDLIKFVLSLHVPYMFLPILELQFYITNLQHPLNIPGLIAPLNILSL